MISTAADATLSVAGPRLSNGAFSLQSPLEGLGTVKTWTAPTSNDVLAVGFRQKITATEPLRTGAYSAALTFTLSTTNP